MQKKYLLGVTALCGIAALGLASCNAPAASTTDAADEFDQNTEAKSNVTMYIIGSAWNSWGVSTIDKANPSCAFTVDPNTTGLDTAYTFTADITTAVMGDWCGFKFIATPSWSSQFGMEDLDFEKSKAFFEFMYGDKNGDGVVDVKDKYEFKEGTSNRNNVVITKACKIKISYFPYHFTSEEVEGVPYTNKFAIELVD